MQYNTLLAWPYLLAGGYHIHLGDASTSMRGVSAHGGATYYSAGVSFEPDGISGESVGAAWQSRNCSNQCARIVTLGS